MKGLLAACLALAASVGCRDSSERAETPSAVFKDVAAETGLVFHHFTGATGEFYMPEIIGAGCALLDYDNDGDLDVFLIQGALLGDNRKMSEVLFPPPGGEPLTNRFYRNELIPSGRLRFTEVTRDAGLQYSGYGMGAATGDFDNDGFVDLYLTNFGSNVLYRNQGDGTFRDVTRTAGVDDPRWSTSAAFLDYDRDGDLDLFVLNYLDFTVKGNKRCYAPTGEPDYCTPKAYQPVSAKLFRNEGKGRFTDVTVPSGVASAYGPGLGITCADLNADGSIDVFVANDTAANLLWINQRDGTFRESALLSGAAYSEDGLAKAGMGVSAGDFDGDADDDLIVVNLAREGATLFRNDGKAVFQDVTLRRGLGTITFPFTGFGLEWFDYDNDGSLDLFIANGAVTLMEELRGKPYPFLQKNLLIRNQETGFRDVSAEAGDALALAEVSRGAAFGDIDNDGDLDILVTNNNGPVRLLRNDVGSRRRWLAVSLESAGSSALGARLGLRRTDGKTLWRRAHTDSSYLSASDPRVFFGLDQAGVDAIEVIWPDGRRERWNQIEPDQSIVLRRGSGVPAGK